MQTSTSRRHPTENLRQARYALPRFGGYGGLVIEGNKSNPDVSFFPIKCTSPQNASNTKSVQGPDQPKPGTCTGQHQGYRDLDQKCGTRTSEERSLR
ncbi:hypothetical protein VN97_g12711 [Penicillium thymicola]|uniref:Uncharacterized protein n=1 Tax=Penicillium thymicola TaxID=293382 RepID=A0AAI9T515_PENTH|nr:hypothetical protein VN97_g12711 [Penicillium thymicola]